MNKKIIDLSGKRFGELTIVKLSSTSNGRTKWECLCDCGSTFISEANSIKTGNTKSCGCLRKKNTAKMKFKHGYRHKVIYNVWCHMKDRCLNENNPAYHNYGGRGISICKEWMNPKTFCDWAMENGWKQGL